MNDNHNSLEHGIAIIGMAGRFPAATDVAELWRNVLGGKVALKKFTPEEVQASILADDQQSIPYRVEEVSSGGWVAAGFWMDDVDKFDADFFGYTPAEAELLDPQQRLFLESSWSAVEDAGYVPDECPAVVGIFGGAAMSRYFLKNVYSHREIMYSTRDLTAGIGNEPDYVTNRVAFKFNYTGPAVSVQTACSTSLVAVHLACQSLLTGETDMCLAGGVLVSVPSGGYLYREGSMNSPDGAVRAFDASAEGTVFSDAGVAVVCLKRLEDALADGDHVYAVIRGTAVGNDGSVKAGYTAPGIAGQKKVISEALSASGISPDSIGYMEAHGTGTPMGDPVEFNALSQAWRTHTDRSGFCAIGSLKPNIGHLATAAGVASLIKAAMVVREGVIPPLVNYATPNPMIDFASSPFYVPEGLQAWPSSEQPRRAAVSSFGIGGTNAHVIIEQAPQPVSRKAAHGPWIFPLSARTPAALARQANQLADWLDIQPDAALRDVAFTLQHGRKMFDHRSVVAASDSAGLVAALRTLAQAGGERTLDGDIRVAWMFSGQGTQYVDMARGLYGQFSVFTETLDACLDSLAGTQGIDLRPMLLSADGADRDALAVALARTEHAQPALFAVEYALARQLQSLGIVPTALIGHSLGEYVVACLAGVFDLDAALELVALRGRLMQSMPAGAMLAVSMDADLLRPYLAASAHHAAAMAIAADNAPATSVASGPAEAIDALRQRLEADGHACRVLVTSHAFHSPSMRPIVAEFEATVRRARPRPPEQAFVSNVTGTWITDAEAVDPAYWSGHLLGTVRFREGLRTLADAGCNLLLEIGPGNALATFARRTLGAGESPVAIVETVRHPREDDHDARRFAQALGRCWSAGLSVDWDAVGGDADARRTSLPTYPFERESHWLRAAETGGSEIVQRLDPAQWFSIPSWTRGRRAAVVAENTDWSTRTVVLVGSDAGANQAHAAALAADLRARGAQVLRVRDADGFASDGEGGWHARLDNADQVSAALQAAASTLAEGARLAVICLPTLELADEPVAAELDGQFFALLNTCVALADLGMAQPPVLLSVSAGAFPVLPDEPLRPLAATAIGVHLSIGHEMPTWPSRHLDFAVDAARDAAVPARVVSELDALYAAVLPQIGWSDKAVAYRMGARWTADLDTAALAAPPQSAIRRGGVYLITGGLGGLGLALAQSFAEQGAAAVVLLGRSPLPARSEWNTLVSGDGDTARRVRAVLAIESLGTRVETVGIDVCNAADMRAVVDDLCTRHGRIDGAVHAAGVAGGGVMQLKRREDALRVLDPKIFGTHALCSALAANPAARDSLGFVALFSSLFAQIGGIGQVDYAAGNAYLDAYAHHARSRWNLPTISLGWGPWDEVGMAARHGHTAAAPKLGGTPLPNPHPLVHNEVERTANRFEVATLLKPGALWMLTDHRLSGVPAMPGTGLLEMVRGGFEIYTGQRYAEFEEVYFFRPLFVAADAGIEARVRYADAGSGRWSFEVLDSDGSGGFAPVATGMVRAAIGETPAFDAEAATALCADAHEVYADGRMPVLGEDGFLSLGRHWDVVQRLDFGARTLIAELHLPAGEDSDAALFPLHPSLLDMATGPITGHLLARLDKAQLGQELQGEYLPSNYGRLQQFGALTGRLRSFVRFDAVEEDGESILFDIDIVGEQGLVASIRRFTLRRIAAGRGRAKVEAAAPSRAWSDAITPIEGLDAFERILASPGEPHWVVLPLSVKGLLARQREELRRASEASNKRASQLQRRDDDGFAAPQTEAEKLLVDIYEKVLGVAPIGIHDNFFELGGDSVIGIQIVAQAKARGLQVKPAQLFEFQTVASLAAAVGGSAIAPAPVAATTTTDADSAANTSFDDSGLSEEDLKSLLSL